MKSLDQEPQFWLTPRISETIFDKLSQYIQFDEPIPPFSTRFPGRLESILGSVKQTAGGVPVNNTVLDAAVSYFIQISLGHPLLNGNKRLAVLLTHVFLILHDIDFSLSYKGLYNLAMFVSTSDMKIDELRVVCKTIFRKFTSEVKIDFVP